MTREVECALIGKWRILEADLWDRDDLDLVGPALSATTPRNPPQVVEEYPPST